MKLFSKYFALCVAMLSSLLADAQDCVEYSAGVISNASSGEFAPYFIGALNGGKITRKASALVDVAAFVDLDLDRRFSWGVGVELLGGYSSSNDYDRWNAETKQWGVVSNKPSSLWIQQLYAELKFRGVFLRVGQQDHTSALLNEDLSSGDLSRSYNARGIPGFEVGFINFQDVPYTNGWLQIEGVVEYGKFMDGNFNEQQFNHYKYVLSKDTYYLYRRCYFRTNPNQRLSMTIGMQATGEFGGSWYRYSQGVITRFEERGFKFSDVKDMFIPTIGSSSVDGYHEGNSLGTWDLKLRYLLNSGAELSFAFQGPWEDGSGIGRANGMDGLWGIYYENPERNVVSGFAFEYLDFTNHSGPIHWSTSDAPGTSITSEATGGDDYYNNEYYGGFTNYGVSIATPFMVAPLYNLNGFSGYANNYTRGVHIALKGCLGDALDYSVKYSYQKAWGRSRVPSPDSLSNNSMMLSLTWDAYSLAPGLLIDAKVAFDSGSLRGDNFGAMLGISYFGNFCFR